MGWGGMGRDRVGQQQMRRGGAGQCTSLASAASLDPPSSVLDELYAVRALAPGTKSKFISEALYWYRQPSGHCWWGGEECHEGTLM